MNIIITGFEPFLNRKENPSKAVLPLLEEELTNHDVRTLVLPVVFDECFSVLKREIEQSKPDLILLLGLSEKEKRIALERVAINVNDARGEDNKGQKPYDERIMTDGENAYFSTLPLRTFEQALKKIHVPVGLSNTAGTYVCNNVMYHTLHYLHTNNLQDIQAGFIHLPLMREQVIDEPFSLPLVTLKDAIVEMVKSIQ